MDVSDARKQKALEEENAKLKKLLAEQMLDNDILQSVACGARDLKDVTPTSSAAGDERAIAMVRQLSAQPTGTTFRQLLKRRPIRCLRRW